MKKTVIAGLLLLTAFAGSFAQDALSLSGQIVDEKTREPLPYVSLLVANTTIGTMANEEGKFVLHLDPRYRAMRIQFFMLGYEMKEVAIAALQSGEIITLKVSPTMLREVVVQDLSAKEILKRAYRYKSRNYPVTPFQFDGYYREIQRADGRNVSLVEAFARVSEVGYHKTEAQKIHLQQLRLAEKYTHPVAPFWDKKNLMLEFLNQNFVKYVRTVRNLKVTRKADTHIDGVPVYVLEVHKKNWFWPGTVYVRSDNYAIIRTEENYDCNTNGPRRWRVDDNPMVESHVQAKTLQINYREVDGRYFPDNYRMYFHNIYKDIAQKTELLEFEIFQQFVVTRLYPHDQPDSIPGVALQKDTSLKKIALPLDTTFWKTSPIRDSEKDLLMRRQLGW